MTSKAAEQPERRKDHRVKPWRRDVVIGAALVSMLLFGTWWVFGVKTGDITESRRQALIATCRETNHHHNRTAKKLTELTQTQIKRHPERKSELQASLAQTIGIIDALAPLHSCEQRARRLVP